MPAGWKFGRVSSVATNPAGTEVYVFHRGKKADPLIVFDNKGKYLRSWGKGMFGNPHGLRVDRDGFVWITDNGDHQVMKFTKEGKLLMTLGIKGKAGTDSKTFNRPTDVAFAKNGDFYVSDGYGNSRVVKFSKDGKYLLDWGKKGTKPGEFNTPHSVALDSKGTVYAFSDREITASRSLIRTVNSCASGPIWARPRTSSSLPKTRCGSSPTGTISRI